MNEIIKKKIINLDKKDMNTQKNRFERDEKRIIGNKGETRCKKKHINYEYHINVDLKSNQ